MKTYEDYSSDNCDSWALGADYVLPHVPDDSLEESPPEVEEEPDYVMPVQEHYPRFTLPLVMNDLVERQAMGIKKYGKSLDSKTDEDMLQHLYEELLDASMYIRTLIEQRKKNNK